MRSFEVIPRVTLCNDKLTYQAYIHTYIPNYLMYRSYLLDNLTGARNQSTPLTYIILLQADGLPPPPPPLPFFPHISLSPSLFKTGCGMLL